MIPISTRVIVPFSSIQVILVRVEESSALILATPMLRRWCDLEVRPCYKMGRDTLEIQF